MSRAADIEADPFGEHHAPLRHWSQPILGMNVRFESAAPTLLRLSRAAFGNLPAQRFPRERRQLRIELRMVPGRPAKRPFQRPATLFSGGGLLGGIGEAGNAVLLAPELRRGLVQVSADSLRHEYAVRYELIEFAVYTLAARVQKLTSLHGAAVGRDGRGVLLMGPSGAGKSTLSLLCALRGFDFLSEDSVFVRADSLLATGAPGFLHARADTLRWVSSAALRERLRASPVIRRRSGVRKFEIDLRQRPFRIAPAPLKIESVILLSPLAPPRRQLLEAISAREMAARLRELQGYAARQNAWPPFVSQLPHLRLLRLHRAAHPEAAVDAIEELLR